MILNAGTMVYSRGTPEIMHRCCGSMCSGFVGRSYAASCAFWIAAAHG